ncbi:MAG: acyltransferase domain-containing protein [Moorea sp. SIO4A3]|nr:acyltransferase domain-containing protein [Moorena sp. SIO4A3]
MEPIAIIGIGCRFPGAKNPDSFWQLLRNGVDAITEVPSDRWDVDAFYNPTPATTAKTSTRWGGFLESVDQFEPSFFGISSREAQWVDPQQRLILEVAWEALENAGLVAANLAGSKTGVFIGISHSDYDRLIYKNLSYISAHHGTGTYHCIAANRLSYVLDLRGPSMAIDTACSSSLMAVHLACQSLRTRESHLALVGGVNLMLSPEETIGLSQALAMSVDGRCKTFDVSANGYVRGEGCGIIVLKRLSDALRDGDNVLAMIRGSAANQNGLSNGLTAPNGPSQQAVIRQALENAGCKPAQISYVEAHGTGTSLGDSIEVKSLKTVLSQGRSPEQPCWIGSVKTNIGHLETAAGIASIIKVVLSMQHGEIPPHLHLNQLNPYISLEGTTFSIPTEGQAWLSSPERRLAGVSAFSFGGANCHLILEEAPLPLPSLVCDLERPLQIFTLSAKSEEALQELTQRYLEKLHANKSHSEASLADICFTTNTGRSHFKHRLAVVAESTLQLNEQLKVFGTKKETPELVKGQIKRKKAPKIAFLFTGKGGEYVKGMGRQLYETQPTFRKILGQCDAILSLYLDKPLLSFLYPEPEDTLPIDDHVYTQAALFAIDYALFQLWKSWGIEPNIVMGHSLGEYVAATVAGVFSLEDALQLIASRGGLIEESSQNPEMEKELVFQISYSNPQINLIDNVTGKLATKSIATPQYWYGYTPGSGKLAAGIETLHQHRVEVLLEISPQPINEQSKSSQFPVWLSSLCPGKSDWQQLLESLGELYVRGVAIDWSGFDRDYSRRKVVLPTYPWQRSRYWIDTAEKIAQPKAVSTRFTESKNLKPSTVQQPSEPVKQPQPTNGKVDIKQYPILRNTNSTSNSVTQDTASKSRADDLIEWLRNYASERINSRLIDERRCIPPHIVLDFGNRGLFGMQVPPEYGGIGLNNKDTLRVAKQLGAIDQALTLFVGNHNALGVRPIMKYASKTLKEQLLFKLATGREIAAYALTEPGAGSNPRAICSRAIPNGNGGWLLEGSKIWSGSAAWSSAINIFVQHLDPKGKSIGISGFVVPQGAKGLRQGPEALTMGMRGMVQNAIFLDGVSVTPEQLLGEAGAGIKVAQDTMMYGRLGLGAGCIGGMKRCAQLMLRYSERRSVSTGRLLNNPVTLVRLSDLTAAITALETLVFTIAELLDLGCYVPEEAHTACKTSGPEFFWQAADHLVQLLGGRGYIENNIAPQILRDARVFRIFEGPTETLNMFLGSRVINKSEELDKFLSNELGAPEIAQTLKAAAEQIKDRLTNSGASFSEHHYALQWAYVRIGEVATLAILLAAVQGAFKRNYSKRLHRAANWAKLQFEQKLKSVISGTPGELVVSDADAVSAQIYDYAATIGDLEQTLAGEDHELDELLKCQTSRVDSELNSNISLEFSRNKETEKTLENGYLEGGSSNSLENKEYSDTDNNPIYTSESIQMWIENWLARELKIDVQYIDRKTSFADYGMESVMAVELAQDLEDWLQHSLEATILWNFPNIESLGDYLASEIKKEEGEYTASSDKFDFQEQHKKIAESNKAPLNDIKLSIDQELDELENLLGGN